MEEENFLFVHILLQVDNLRISVLGIIFGCILCHYYHRHGFVVLQSEKGRILCCFSFYC